jgi:hypothetical protein
MHSQASPKIWPTKSNLFFIWNRFSSLSQVVVSARRKTSNDTNYIILTKPEYECLPKNSNQSIIALKDKRKKRLKNS